LAGGGENIDGGPSGGRGGGEAASENDGRRRRAVGSAGAGLPAARLAAVKATTTKIETDLENLVIGVLPKVPIPLTSSLTGASEMSRCCQLSVKA